MTDDSFAVFLSYNSGDGDSVEKVAVHLADNAKLQPWFDRWSLVPGEPWVRNLERGLAASASCAVFVGKSGEGPWQKQEVEAALRAQVDNPNFRVIPVLLPEAPKKPDLPTFLKGNTWVDFRTGLGDDQQMWRLECGIQGRAPGRGRPHQQPHQSLDSLATELPPPKSSPPESSPLESSPLAEVTDDGPASIVFSFPPNQSARVFISYRHQEPDSTLAHAFAEALRQAGHNVFIDTGIRWGADWVKRIEAALEEADYLLLLLSREAAASEMVEGEISIARELARQNDGLPVILPVRVNYPFDEALPYQLSIHLRNIHQERWDGPADSQRLTTRLLNTLEDKAGWPENVAETTEHTYHGANSLGLPLPSFDPRHLVTPGGALETDSRFYIMRAADEEVFMEVQKPRGVVTVRGPRQTGKTSLIAGVYNTLCESEQLRPTFIDFQALADEDLQSLDSVWRTIASYIVERLEIDDWDTTCWQPDTGHDRNFSRFLDRFVFKNSKTPLLVCMDEVDRVFDSPLKLQFFSVVRSFINRGAHDRSWKNVRWLLSTSTEPSFFIDNPLESPFNVGLRVELGVFTPDEVEAFARRHGLMLDPDTLSDIMGYVGGRPYLVHLLLYHLVRQTKPRDQLFNARTAGGGIFREHLYRYLMQFQREDKLAAAMRDIVNGRGCTDAQLVNRIEAAGLVRRDENEKVFPLCRLYAEFFQSELE